MSPTTAAPVGSLFVEARASASDGCVPTDLSAVAWTERDIARFMDRRARLLRWGWPEAERVAERLVQADRRGDDRAACIDCTHYRPARRRCESHRAAGLAAPDVGRDLAELLQRCPGFVGRDR